MVIRSFVTHRWHYSLFITNLKRRKLKTLIVQLTDYKLCCIALFAYVVLCCKTFFLARMYESTGTAIAVTPALALAFALLIKMLKFLVKVFISLYLLNILMD